MICLRHFLEIEYPKYMYHIHYEIHGHNDLETHLIPQ